MKRFALSTLMLAAFGGLLHGQIYVPSWSSYTRTGPLNNGYSYNGLNGTAPNLIKTGSGTLTLRGNNEAGSGSAFTGTAFINTGTLIVRDGRAIPNGSEVAVAGGANFRVWDNETIGALTGTGQVTVEDGSKLTVLGVNAGPFSGTLIHDDWRSSTEFQNGAMVLNALIRNTDDDNGVIFNGGVANNSVIENDDDDAFARFQNGASALNGTTIDNDGRDSFASFSGSTADAVTIFNDGFYSRALFSSGSTVRNGTTIENRGRSTRAEFDGSTADSVAIVNRGENSFADFDSGSVATNGTTIQNLGNYSYARFDDGSRADGAAIWNSGYRSYTLVEDDSIATNGTTIVNDGTQSRTTFSDADAGEVTIVNAAGAGAATFFERWSAGSAETTIDNGAGGLLDISGVFGGRLTIGRLFGDGNIELGGRTLAVGSQDSPEDTIGGSFSGWNGSLTKEGSGTLILTGDSAIGGEVNVDEGFLAINGVFTALDGFFVGPNGTLGGSGIVDGDVFNAGSIAPGNSPGILTIAGDLVQTAIGTLVIEVGGSGPISHDQIIVGGTAFLNGTLQVVPLSPASYGDRIDFLQAAGGIEGDFRQVEVTNPDWFRGRFVTPATGLGSLIVAPASYTLVANTPNDRALAGALDRWIGVETGDIATVTLALDQLRGDQFAAAFAAIEPGYYAGALNMQVETSHALGRMLDLQLGSRRFAPRQEATAPLRKVRLSAKEVVSGKEVTPVEEREVDLWVQGSGLFSKGGMSLLPGEEFDSGNVLAGGGMTVTPSLSVGLFGDWGEGYTQLPRNGKLDFERSFFGGYAAFDKGRFYAHAAVGGGSVDFNVQRPIHFATLSRQAAGKPESTEFLGLFTAGYEVPLGSLGYFEPQVSVQYSSVEMDEMTESGAGALNLQVDDAATDSLRTYVGGRLARRIGLKSGAMLAPYLHAHWVHEYLRDGDFFHAWLDGGYGPGFRYLMTNPDEDSLYGGAGVDFWTPTGVNVYVNYNIDLGGTDPDHGVAVGVSKKF